jgi:hypothetical protein
MPMTPAEAADALRDIDQTEQHSSTLHGYAKSSPFLILWGVIWALGYSGTYFFPPYTNLIWLSLAVIGFALTIFYPFSGMQIGSLFPLVIGWSYVVLGIWAGARLTFTGLFIVVLTLVGFFYLPAYFMLWMAFIGGGGLIAGGLWLRSV